jgi:bifunctional non-homologous end joining protein LigD
MSRSLPSVEAALETYRQKRDFAATAEPRGAAPGTGFSFVVQKHAASRLHYDFRLELDGVLKSWAVTKGPSYDPADRRLAVRTEDHPVEYGAFEGTIPKGEYGGGTVMLWDRGTWRPLHDPQLGLEQGHLHFALDGGRLKGEWNLVRLRPDRRGGRENWLLIKSRDGFAEAASEAGLLGDDARSIDSGKTMEQIALGEASDADPPPETRPRTRRRKLPSFVEPELATLVNTVPDGPDWLHEIKYDGYRALAAIAGDQVRMFTRRGLDWTERFRRLVAPFLTLGIGSALIDGEIVVVGPDGRTSFKRMQDLLGDGPTAPLSFFAFDLLALDGKELGRLPLRERKAMLAKVLGQRGRKGPVFLSDHVEGDGPAFLRAACERGLEGIVSKKADAGYRSGRSRDWLKIKCSRRQEVVIGGWQPSDKPDRPFASLLLGWFDADGRLQYAGKVGTGFNRASMARLAVQMSARERKTSPFASVPADIRRLGRWVRPELVAEVEFTEWTPDGRLRHPSFQGLRQDKAASDVRRELPQEEGSA